MSLLQLKISADAFMRALNLLKMPYVIIGAIPVGYYSRDPRPTQDLDFTIPIAIAKERFAELLQELDNKGIILASSRPTVHDLSTLSSLRFIDTKRKTAIDLVINPEGFTFDDESEKRFRKVKLWGNNVNFPSPEDLLVMKLARGESQDYEDAEKITAMLHKDLDWDYMRKRADKFRLGKPLQKLFDLFKTA